MSIELLPLNKSDAETALLDEAQREAKKQKDDIELRKSQSSPHRKHSVAVVPFEDSRKLMIKISEYIQDVS